MFREPTALAADYSCQRRIMTQRIRGVSLATIRRPTDCHINHHALESTSLQLHTPSGRVGLSGLGVTRIFIPKGSQAISRRSRSAPPEYLKTASRLAFQRPHK